MKYCTDFIIIRKEDFSLDCVAVRDGVDEGVKVECWQVWIFCLDVENHWGVVPAEVNILGHVVEEVREGNAVLSTNLVSHNDLVDVIEFIPVFISWVHVLDQWFKLWATRQSHV